MEDKSIKKSIFKRETYIKKYKNKLVADNLHSKMWTLKCLEECELIENVIIYTLDIPFPLLSKGDKFYIENSDEIIVIKEAIRTSEDGVLYIVEPNILIDEELRSLSETFKDKEIESFISNDEYVKLIEKNLNEELQRRSNNYIDNLNKLFSIIDEHNRSIFNRFKKIKIDKTKYPTR